jgi:maltooligosyltrehalose trehalohydrolase
VTHPPTEWAPSLGAWCEPRGVAFRVWAPAARTVDVVIQRGPAPRIHPLERCPDGTFSGVVASARAGDRYFYRLDGDRQMPDPASRAQPDGVHGPSQVIDPRPFRWSDDRWAGVSRDDLVIYELHVGTFSPEGTFAGAAARLADLAALGVTAIELMPVADFPGARNWGYDGVALFAPARCYGQPHELRRLVDTAHALGLAVILDVVYNHLGPDGAYLWSFSPFYGTDRHHTPWGWAVNFDGEDSGMVRAFFIENACHWIHEYHIDGLRLDATYAMFDDGPRHFLAELTATVRASARRPVVFIAEDHRNLNRMLQPESDGGWGLDAVWADGFHHQCRRLLTGDSEGYFCDYSGTAADLATTVQRGWFYVGQHSPHFDAPRGTDPAGLSARQFVFCIQNHDQVGNRAFGDRLHHQIDSATYRAASALLLLAPETPLLFMGQEWAATSPFLYFTDHNPDLGRLVTEGRRREFESFAAFTDPATRQRIPDPQAEPTFARSRLVWPERQAEPHASTLRLYAALLDLRRRSPALRDPRTFHAEAADDATVLLDRVSGDAVLLVVVRLKGAGVVECARPGRWRAVLTTEDAGLAPDPAPVGVEASSAGGVRLAFSRPGAVVLERV